MMIEQECLYDNKEILKANLWDVNKYRQDKQEDKEKIVIEWKEKKI